MKILLTFTCAALLCSRASAWEDVFASYFRGSRPIRITIKMAAGQERGAMRQFATLQLSLSGESGYIYAKIPKAERVPTDAWDVLEKNLFFEKGTVREKDSRTKQWAEYRCTREAFLDYIFYIYSGAGILTGTAQQALNGEPGYKLRIHGDSVLIQTKSDNPANQAIRRIEIRNGRQISLRNVVFVPSSSQKEKGAKTIVAEEYSYNSPRLIAPQSTRFSGAPQIVENPLQGRMKYP